ncbi:hypothetical protein FSP39_014646 [Pinctada imbricata]|uniref:Target of EGR1 protein 1 n=1 Tax=Pinctada imbricata TaxID=66713 RepID=A0AA89BQY9_PINIB|nr:hypothetical protein FSP39_014646 [Pinctada imbricata]
MTTRFEKVPVVDITKNNFQLLWPSICKAISTSTFVAMDTELSGIGTRKLLMAKSIEDRYNGMSDIAKTRSIVSFGISCFKLENARLSDEGSNSECKTHQGVTKWEYAVETFNLTALCSEEYVVEPNSLKFLLNHGFDFNRQYSSGIPYHRGNDRIPSNEEESLTLRHLFTEIVCASKPVVFHNGLMDLIYLYQNFYANLPTQISTFLSDLTEVFSCGIFDTKYIADYVQMLPASYLEYVFSRSQRENCVKKNKGQSYVSVSFPHYEETANIIDCCCPLPDEIDADLTLPREAIDSMRQAVCESFAGHGWCELGINCTLSHDMDLILDLDKLGQTKEVRKRKRRNKNKQQSLNSIKNGTQQIDGEQISTENMETDFVSESTVVVEKTVNLPSKYLKSECDVHSAGCHRSGYDAFMTGFTLAVCLSQYGNYSGSYDMSNLGIEQFKNNISLSGKDMPLTVSKSSFSKTSKEHRDKMERIRQKNNI